MSVAMPQRLVNRPRGVLRLLIVLSITGLVFSGTLAGAEPAAAAPLGSGAVSVKGEGGEPIPGANVVIYKNACLGQAVWAGLTGSNRSDYGAFAITLEAGTYCMTTSTPAPYQGAPYVTFVMEPRVSNWVTVWVPDPSAASGALVAKDSVGRGIDGVTALVQTGSCAARGQGVWQNTTATSRWAVGGFGIALGRGTYCITTLAVPSGYRIPEPVEVQIARTLAPLWITVWVPAT